AAEPMMKKRKAAPELSFSEAMKDPVFATAWRKQQMRKFEQNYGDAIATLNLPPDKLARLKELMMAREESISDARDAGRAAGLSNAELTKAILQARDLWADQIKGLIGPDGYAQLDRNEKALPLRPLIESSFAIDLK